MLMAILMVLGSFQTPASIDSVEVIKNSTLDMFPDKTVDQAFRSYRWFATGQWDHTARDDGRTLVTFRGEWPDAPAVQDFHKRFRYSVKMSMLAMQMHSKYSIDKDKDRLAFLVDFLVEADGSFSVVSGKLAVRKKSSQEWRIQDLPDKALLRIIQAMYSDENPYAALCNGLPYR